MGLDARKRISHIYYKVLVVVVSSGVKYDCLSIESDEDLQVLFHCRQQYLEVQTTKLYIETDDVGVSSGGSILHPQPVHAGGTHVPLPMHSPVIERVASPSFDVNLQEDNDDACHLGDNHSFDELAVAMAGMLRPPSP
ncbi:hypothetical protein PIB30_002902 [Stylosanthes scabra]|uniref:Uncharacterized protein n=1 Tax=Stylosanthes scabra TaxID=79078 RepID=A0ABU6U311_9FABA|nr:hypothetical protein [Stylosanthes scabra]